MEFSKKTLEDIAILAILILVGIGGFGLGRLSVEKTGKEPLHILRAGSGEVSQIGSKTAIPRESSTTKPEGEVVASKNSDKYHYLWCPGAKQISENNKILFRSATEAENAGYIKASNCKE